MRKRTEQQRRLPNGETGDHLAIEMQAIDRTYRIGQQKEVEVYRILTQETVEDRIVASQNKKKEIVEAALDEAESMKIGRLGESILPTILVFLQRHRTVRSGAVDFTKDGKLMLGDKRDVKSLCEVSKTLYDLASTRLYSLHEVILQSLDEDCLDEVHVKELLRAAGRPNNLLSRVVNLRISAPFSKRLRHRCIHGDENDYGDDGQVNDLSSLQRLSNRILPILQNLQDGKLRKFNWDMGVCVPRQILGKNGYLPNNQSHLEYVRLVTDPTCVCNSHTSPLALQELRCLKGISWTGLRTRPDLVALGLALQENAGHLEVLELDFIDWPLVRRHWNDLGDDFGDFFDYALRVRPRSTNRRYPALQKLSLSGLDLTPYFRGIAAAMDSVSLQSIAVHRCLGWELLLEHWIESHRPLSIKSLEIYQPLISEGISGVEEQALRTFLENVSGLENLYLSLPSPMGTKILWRTAVRHRATLRRFIYHARSVNLDGESDRFEEEMDLNDMALLSDSFLARLGEEYSVGGMEFEDHLWFTEQSPNPLEVLEPFSGKESLQIVHIRQSGPDIKQFGSWVFNQIWLDDATLFEDYIGPARRELCEDGMLGWVSWQSDVANTKDNLVATILTNSLCEFADWAFGANGITSLHIIAYGDFSCQGRDHTGSI
ncbi:hypothetical protein VFPPC_18559 [Pochonia chlamydosporia 170]|uniref:Uncharacterized protein n=1 Tax=Pochonia chlamydosporia 170 TaxID=1380566 RepID=A0A219AQB4_METCM|nr:hypothetical protein VFPPC_18559 [Pochonia chlamydosporia 170]OWT42325.1 hypothetical protein VFPPC_18559 [Pochonia chlamydosporia 170]